MSEHDTTEETTGRALVRQVLWSRIDEAGVKPPKGQTRETWGKLRAHMTDRFDHMGRASLEVLADEIIEEAARRHGQCPSEVVLRQWAEGLEKRPLILKPIVTSWLRSIEGPAAAAGGFLPELYELLQRLGRPPGAYDMTRVREQAERNRREETLIRDRIARGVASEDDRSWLEHRERIEQAAARLVEDGRQHRAAKARDAGDAA